MEKKVHKFRYAVGPHDAPTSEWREIWFVPEERRSWLLPDELRPEEFDNDEYVAFLCERGVEIYLLPDTVMAELPDGLPYSGADAAADADRFGEYRLVVE